MFSKQLTLFDIKPVHTAYQVRKWTKKYIEYCIKSIKNAVITQVNIVAVITGVVTSVDIPYAMVVPIVCIQSSG